MPLVLNIAAYRFVPIEDGSETRARLAMAANAHGLKGTVLVAPEGINLFLAGRESAVRGFLDELRTDPRFAALTAKESWSDSVPFARLKVKLKREIIAFRRDGVDPVVAPAPFVAPATLKRWLDAGCDDEGKPVLMLDTRNREEVAHGTFHGALTLPIDDFVQLPEALESQRQRLRDATVVSFCTGGIRCEKAAPLLRAQGFGDVRQLDGGILGYFEHVGGAHWAGACFVFDERVALGPDLRPVAETSPDA
ncbi:MAG: sulfurtransferase [Silanimonas sp.]